MHLLRRRTDFASRSFIRLALLARALLPFLLPHGLDAAAPHARQRDDNHGQSEGEKPKEGRAQEAAVLSHAALAILLRHRRARHPGPNLGAGAARVEARRCGAQRLGVGRGPGDVPGRREPLRRGAGEPVAAVLGWDALEASCTKVRGVAIGFEAAIGKAISKKYAA